MRAKRPVLFAAIGAILSTTAAASTPTVPSAPASSNAETSARVGTFLPNAGQLRGRARFYVVGGNSAAYFEPDAVILRQSRGAGAAAAGVLVKVDFPHAPTPPEPEGRDAQASRVNVFVGSEPARWREGAASFGEVLYRGVAPGADLAYRIHDGRLKYDLLLSPGADLSVATLRYHGVLGLSVGRDGELVVETRGGALREGRPLLYQEISGRRVEVAGGYRVISNDEVGFWAASYDHGRPLVVDPGMMWSTFIGGAGADNLIGVATNSNGDVYTVGYTASVDYPTSPGAYRGTKQADDDVVVTKLRSDGSMVWSTYLGGSAWDAGRAIAVDGGGNVYVTGETLSPDFPVSPGAFHTQLGMAGTYDAFVTKLGPNGDVLVYSTYLGGISDDKGTAIAVNSSGQATVGGSTGSTDFPTTPGVVKSTRSPGLFDGSDGFVTKLNATGTALVYSTYLGSNSGTESVRSLVLDGNDQPTLTGPTASPDYPTTSGAFSRSLKGIKDAFVTRLNATGSGYVFSTYVGGSGVEDGYGVGVDAAGNAYAVGGTTSTDFGTTSGVFQPLWGGGTNVYDAFVIKISPTGGLIYGSYLGGGGSDVAYGVAVRSDGNLCVTGVSASTNFPVTAGSAGYLGGAADGFVSSVVPDGTRLVYSSYLGSAGNDQSMGIALRPNGSAAVVGYTDGVNFPTSATAYDRTANGGMDGFVTIEDMGIGSPTAVGDPGSSSPPGLELAGPNPNPFRDLTSGLASVTAPGHAYVRVVDPMGRVVRHLIDDEWGPGLHRWSWDGMDDHGRPLGAGTYLVEIGAASRRAVTRVVLLK